MTDKQRRQLAHDTRIKQDMQAFTMQLCFDLFGIAMREAGISEDKAIQIDQEVNKSFFQIAKIWEEDTPDKEYSFEILDRRLKQLFPKHIVPWEKRYEGLFRR